MTHEPNLKEIQNQWHGSYRSYAIGLFLSLILTGASFSLVILGIHHPYLLMVLALIQAIVQLIFFLHLGQEAHPRWESLSFYFMVLILLIVVVGTLWIMYDLDKRVMANMM